MFKRISTLVTLAILAVMLFPFAVPAQASGSDAKIYIVHGINGSDLGLPADLPVDISVDAACALPNFTFGQITDAINLPGGTYSVAIRPANSAAPCSEAPLLGPISLTFGDGGSYAVVANLTEAAAPTASMFMLDTGLIKKGTARVILAHTAAAPTVDVRLGRNLVNKPMKSAVIPGFSNGEQAQVDVRSGKYQAALYLPGTMNVAFGPATLFLAPKTTTLVFAVGNISTGTFTLLTKVIK